jgi:hypothetical protein
VREHSGNEQVSGLGTVLVSISSRPDDYILCAVAEQGKLQGWQADPFGSHEKRYFSGGRPTKLVRDGDVESYDEPPAEGSISLADGVATAAAGGMDTAISAEIDIAAVAPSEAATAVTEQTVGEPGLADTPAATAEPAAVATLDNAGDGVAMADDHAASPASAASAPAEALLVLDRVPADEPAAVASGTATDTGAELSGVAPEVDGILAGLGVLGRRPRGLLYAAVALAAIVAVIAVIAITGGFSPHAKPGTFGALAQSGSNQNAGAAPLDPATASLVTASAQGTLAQKTADVTLTGTATGAGAALPLQGTGQVDFSTYATVANLGATESGGSIAEEEIATSKHILLQLALGGHSLIVESTGRHWMDIPISEYTDLSENVTAYSLPWSLQLLAQQPDSVASIGTKSVGGVTCSGFTVTPSKQALLNVVQQEWAHVGFPAKDKAAALKSLQNEVAAPITAWFDPHRHLACEMTVDMQLTNVTTTAWAKQPTTASVQMTADFTHYGVPVQITLPPGSDVVHF